MDARIVMTCHRCGCSTEYSTSCNRLEEMNICHNCGQQLLDRDYIALQDALISLDRLPSETTSESGFTALDEGFTFSVHLPPYSPYEE